MKQKGHLATVVLIFIFLAGVSLLLYPTFSDWWNSFHQSSVISNYVYDVQEMDAQLYERLLSDAGEYNKELEKSGFRFELSEEELKKYNSILDVSGNGMMGYVEIPLQKISLPIYHGTSEEVLAFAAGHLEGTSLPIGGEGTHCVISGHRGMPSARLFTDLDQVNEGDVFYLKVLDEVLTYEVDQILIVEPYEVEALQIEKGKDYCTLVTCTPYGINTHRLLVRGRRIANTKDARKVRVSADAIQIDPMLIVPVVAAPILLALLIILLITTRKKNRGKMQNANREERENAERISKRNK